MEIIEINKNNQKSLNNNNKRRITIWTDFLLCSKINNYIEGQIIQGDFRYRNLSDFFRIALTLYQSKELKPIRYRVIQRKQIGVNLDDNLNAIYLSLPTLMKTQIINDLLNGLLIKETEEANSDKLTKKKSTKR